MTTRKRMRNAVLSAVFVMALGGLLRAEEKAAFPEMGRREVDPRFSAFDQLDLRQMPTGDALARHDVKAIPWQSVEGPKVRKTWSNEKKVEIRDLALKVNWPEPTTKYSGTLF